jgi:atypical dual specificity phosphatase
MEDREATQPEEAVEARGQEQPSSIPPKVGLVSLIST